MRRAQLAMLLGMTMAATTLWAPAAQAGSIGGKVVMVDDDGRALPGRCGAGGAGSAATTVQAGFDAVAPGGTVYVCPGTYVEQVELTGKNGVTVRATKPWKATIQAPPSADAPFIVGIIHANGTTLQWMRVVTRTTAGCERPMFGILAVAARNVSIRSNRVRNLGDTLGACGFLIGIGAGYPFAGPVSAGGPTSLGVGPAGLSGDLTTVADIRNNAVRDHVFMGIAAMSSIAPTADVTAAPTRATIAGNSVRYFHTGVDAAECSATSAATGSLRAARRGLARLLPAGLPACDAVGIYVGVSLSDSPVPGAAAIVTGNRVLSGPSAGLGTSGDTITPLQGIGIVALDPRHAVGATVVARNQVFRNLMGIVAIDASGIAIKKNTVYQDVIGIVVADTEGASVRGNVATQGLIGILAADQLMSGPAAWLITSDVTFANNAASGNGQFSCEDDTTSGGGTLGTANIWTGNTAEDNSSDPKGICGAAVEP